MTYREITGKVASRLIEMHLLPVGYQQGAEAVVRAVNDMLFAYDADKYKPARPNKKRYVHVSEYPKWLKLVAEYYKVKESDIIARNHHPGVVRARQTFLWICLYEGIDIMELSKLLGKNRTTLWCIMRQGRHNRNLEDEQNIRFQQGKLPVLKAVV